MTDHIDTAQERKKLAEIAGEVYLRCDTCSEDCNCHPAQDMWLHGDTLICDSCADNDDIPGYDLVAASNPVTTISRLLDALDAERVEREQGQRDYCDLMTRHDAHFSMWQLTKVRAEKAEEKVKLDAITLETQAEIIRRMKAERGQALARLAAVQRETLDRCAAIGFNCDYEAQGAHGLALEISSVVIDSDAEAALQKLLDAKFNAGLTAATELVAHDYICEAIRALKRPEISHE